MMVPRFGLNRFDARSVDAFAADVRRAEELGWDAALQPDSQLRRRDTYVLLAAAARATERIVLGPLLANPVNRHPTVTASSIATIDELAPGRTLLGWGVGDTAVRLAGLRPARVKELEASTRLMRALLDGEAVEVGAARPAQLPHHRPVPIWIAAGGPRTLRMAGGVADGVFIRVGTHAANIGVAVEAIRAGAAEAGRDPAAVRCGGDLPHGARGRAGAARSRWASRWPPATTSTRPPSSRRRGLAWAGPHPETLKHEHKVWPDFHHAPDLEASGRVVDFLPTDAADAFCLRGGPDADRRAARPGDQRGAGRARLRRAPSDSESRDCPTTPSTATWRAWRARSCRACGPGSALGRPEVAALTTAEEGLSEHARRNRAAWDRQADDWREPGQRAWAETEPTWGIWQVPESELRVLPDVDGQDVIELGCGTAYWSAWLARRGARVTGIDNSARQLQTARQLQREHGLEFPLLHGSAEAVPLPDASFDLAFSEYGASIWCDPRVWVPEAARLLRPGGRLIFMKHSTILTLCGPDDDAPVGDRLVRNYFGLHRLEWSTDGSVEFDLPYAEWIDLFRACGFTIERLVAVQAPAGATSRHKYVSLEWARRWPTEDIWRVRKGWAS